MITAVILYAIYLKTSFLSLKKVTNIRVYTKGEIIPTPPDELNECNYGILPYQNIVTPGLNYVVIKWMNEYIICYYITDIKFIRLYRTNQLMKVFYNSIKSELCRYSLCVYTKHDPIDELNNIISELDAMMYIGLSINFRLFCSFKLCKNYINRIVDYTLNTFINNPDFHLISGIRTINTYKVTLHKREMDKKNLFISQLMIIPGMSRRKSIIMSKIFKDMPTLINVFRTKSARSIYKHIRSKNKSAKIGIRIIKKIMILMT